MTPEMKKRAKAAQKQATEDLKKDFVKGAPKAPDAPEDKKQPRKFGRGGYGAR
jgi:hypothetical protein